MSHPRRRAMAVLACIVALGALGVVAVIGDRGSNTTANEPADGSTGSVVTHPVEVRVLERTLQLDATLQPAHRTALGATVGAGAERVVVTSLPKKVGEAIKEGEVAFEVSGRPVIVLQGAIPAFRELLPGIEGVDVRQLQAALARLNLDPGTSDGLYGPRTEQAVTQLWQRVGHRPALSDPEFATTKRTLERAVEEAEQAVALAKIDAKGADARARLALTSAQSNLTMAVETRSEYLASNGVSVPAGEIAFVPQLPATVAQVSASLGGTPTDEVLSLMSGALTPVASTSTVPPELTVGLPAHLDCGAGPSDTTVASLSSSPTGGGTSGDSPATGDGTTSGSASGQVAPAASQTEVRVAAPKGLTARRGQACSLSVVLEVTPKANPVVPVAALFTTPDGRTTIRAGAGSGTLRDVAVEVLLEAGGWAAVSSSAMRLEGTTRVAVSGSR